MSMGRGWRGRRCRAVTRERRVMGGMADAGFTLLVELRMGWVKGWVSESLHPHAESLDLTPLLGGSVVSSVGAMLRWEAVVIEGMCEGGLW